MIEFQRGVSKTKWKMAWKVINQYVIQIIAAISYYILCVYSWAIALYYLFFSQNTKMVSGMTLYYAAKVQFSNLDDLSKR